MFGNNFVMKLASITNSYEKVLQFDKNAPKFEFDNGQKISKCFITSRNIGSVFFLNSEPIYPNFSDFSCHTRGDKVAYKNHYSGWLSKERVNALKVLSFVAFLHREYSHTYMPNKYLSTHYMDQKQISQIQYFIENHPEEEVIKTINTILETEKNSYTEFLSGDEFRGAELSDFDDDTSATEFINYSYTCETEHPDISKFIQGFGELYDSPEVKHETVAVTDNKPEEDKPIEAAFKSTATALAENMLDPDSEVVASAIKKEFGEGINVTDVVTSLRNVLNNLITNIKDKTIGSDEHKETDMEKAIDEFNSQKPEDLETGMDENANDETILIPESFVDNFKNIRITDEEADSINKRCKEFYDFYHNTDPSKWDGAPKRAKELKKYIKKVRDDFKDIKLMFIADKNNFCVMGAENTYYVFRENGKVTMTMDEKEAHAMLESKCSDIKVDVVAPVDIKEAIDANRAVAIA